MHERFLKNMENLKTAFPIMQLQVVTKGKEKVREREEQFRIKILL